MINSSLDQSAIFNQIDELRSKLRVFENGVNREVQ